MTNTEAVSKVSPLVEKKNAARDVLVDIYKTVWHAADAAGREGERTREAIDAVLLVMSLASDSVCGCYREHMGDVFETIADLAVETESLDDDIVVSVSSKDEA